VLREIVDGGGSASAEARARLAQLLYWQGRTGEARAVLIAGWSEEPDRRSALRNLWAIDDDPTTRESIQSALLRAAARAPEDDRVWLGRANLAARSGRLEEASGWLDACLERRPDDPAVWQARLEWALAAGRADEALRASGHLPAGRLAATEVLALRAWFAARRGDAEAERSALEALLEQEPGASEALERLAVLASRSGLTGRSAELRRRKDGVDRAQARYRRLMGAPATAHASARELAELAESLGRWFEARGWWSLAEVSDAQRRAALGRIDRHLTPESPPAGRTLADLLADEAAHSANGRATPRLADTRVIPPNFEDLARVAGLRFTYDSGRSPARHLPETMGGGVGLIDYDGDGWLDVYCVQGGTFPPEGRDLAADRLFHNRGDGTFDDVTDRTGIARMPGGYGHGVAVGDIDNDGHPDLFVTRWRHYALYRNRGDGTFEDVTDRWGLGGDRDWPTSAAFADFDADGDLDLYVCHYLAWNPDDVPPCGRAPDGSRT
jgi:tetratricopeptide (TPR) repeat protein